MRRNRRVIDVRVVVEVEAAIERQRVGVAVQHRGRLDQVRDRRHLHADTARQHIVAAAADEALDTCEGVGAETGRHRSAGGEAGHHCRCGRCEAQRVDACAAVDAVVASIGEHGVIARATAHGVVAVAAQQGVVTCVAFDAVVAITAHDAVVARSAMHRVIASAGVDAVVADAAVDGVAAIATIDHVVAVATHQGVGMG